MRPETGRPFVAHRRATWLDQENLEGVMKRAGIDHLGIDTDRPFVSRLRQFFKSRNLLGRGAR